MKEEIKNSLVEKLNNGLLDIVKQVINSNLGIATSFEVKTTYSNWSEWNISIVENGEETTKQLTASPLLAHLFAKGQIEIKVGYNEKKDAAIFSVAIAYDHHDGSNGHDLMRFDVSLKDNRIEIR